MYIFTEFKHLHHTFVLYVMEYVGYTLDKILQMMNKSMFYFICILIFLFVIVSDRTYSINLGGLQTDIQRGSGGAAAPLRNIG